MSLLTMVVDGTPFLINDESKGVDKTIENILECHPDDAIIRFRSPTKEDLTPNTYPK